MTATIMTASNWWFENILDLGEDVSQRASYWFAPTETVADEPEKFIPSSDPLFASTSSTKADLAAEAINTRRTWQAASRQPISPLGQRLLAIRARIVASGEPLLDWDDLEREIGKRRGGQEDRDA